jgi:coproporphyrinogen III oxidase-like Fe-S oxidoreductase
MGSNFFNNYNGKSGFTFLALQKDRASVIFTTEYTELHGEYFIMILEPKNPPCTSVTSVVEKTASLSSSLYIHVPFCASLCDYCDFYSVEEDDDLIEKYLRAVVADIYHQIEFFDVGEIPTVYIGGGTPSVLGRRIFVLFDALGKIPGNKPV